MLFKFTYHLNIYLATITTKFTSKQRLLAAAGSFDHFQFFLILILDVDKNPLSYFSSSFDKENRHLEATASLYT